MLLIRIRILTRVLQIIFLRGFSYGEILHFLYVYHRKRVSLRQLHRLLRRLFLYRRKSKSDLNDVIRYISNSVKGPASSIGYRSMHQKMRKDGIVTDRETVRLVMSVIDPVGVCYRSRHSFRRRVYSNLGPDFMWHLDGYDKLKPYGFPIHGAIDGFSRKVLWLSARPH